MIDKNILIASALLHDIGKIVEFKTTTYFDYTDKGRLVGHIVIGDEMISEAIKNIPEFPEKLEIKIRHLILSHHGQKEMGAPIVPQTAEAFLLHFADKIDSTMGALERITNAEKTNEKNWSNFVKLLDRFIYFG